MKKYTGCIVALAMAASACAEASATADAGAELPPLIDAGTDDPTPDASVIEPKPDAAVPGTPDAAVPPPTPDAAVPGTPDAAVPPPTPDAACTPTTVPLLTSGNFDMGPGVGWVEGSGASPAYQLIVQTNDNDTLDQPDEFPATVMPHSGMWGAWLGGYAAPLFGTASDTLHQDVAVPASATSIEITGQRWFASEDTSGADFARLNLRAPGGAVLEMFTGPGGWTSTDETTTWQAFAFSPTGSYAGQTIRLELFARVNDSLNSSFFFDSIEVTATVCE